MPIVTVKLVPDILLPNRYGIEFTGLNGRTMASNPTGASRSGIILPIIGAVVTTEFGAFVLTLALLDNQPPNPPLHGDRTEWERRGYGAPFQRLGSCMGMENLALAGCLTIRNISAHRREYAWPEDLRYVVTYKDKELRR